MSQFGTLVETHAENWNERQHVGSTQSRVDALMRSHVDQFTCSRYGAESRFDNSLGSGNEGDHGAIVVRIDMSIKNTRRLDGIDCPRKQLNSFELTAFAEIWYTLDDPFHVRLVKTPGARASRPLC